MEIPGGPASHEGADSHLGKAGGSGLKRRWTPELFGNENKQHLLTEWVWEAREREERREMPDFWPE